jgi:hypothetical protein
LTGLAALTGAIGLAALLKGPDNVTDLAPAARTAAGATFIAAIAAAAVAVWLASLAARGPIATRRSAAAEVRLAAKRDLDWIADRLTASQRLGAVALALLLGAVSISFFADRPTKHLLIERSDGSRVCVPRGGGVTYDVSHVGAVETVTRCPAGPQR